MELVNTVQKVSFFFSKLRSLWSKTFSTVTSPPLAKKKNNNNLARAQHTFLYISLTLFCTTTMWNWSRTQISLCSRLMWNFMLEYVVCAYRCFVVFLFTFFLHCRSFSACWPLFLIFSPPISVFPPTKFVSCVLSNALALLLTASLKTLKFSGTWLCCWFFSLLSPDGLSLSKKSGWILGFPPKNPCCICHTCWLSYFTLICLWCGRACVRSRDYLCTVNQNSYPWCTAARARELRQKCLWWTKTSKTPK